MFLFNNDKILLAYNILNEVKSRSLNILQIRILLTKQMHEWDHEWFCYGRLGSWKEDLVQFYWKSCVKFFIDSGAVVFMLSVFLY